MYCIVKLINKVLDNHSSNLIKTIQLDQESSCHQYEQSLNSPLLKSKGVIAVTAIMETLTGGERYSQVDQTNFEI